MENHFSKKVDSLLTFIDQNHFFAENQNGPYGPYGIFSTIGIWKFRKEKGSYGGNMKF